ncbi:hypothetical protein Tco_1370107 [Tanacetum coccineum]
MDSRLNSLLLIDPEFKTSQPPVKVEVPSELPKVSLVNASLKKLKFHLAQFDSVVKKRTTPDARTEDVLLTVMNSISLIGEYVNMKRKRNESCDKCFNLDVGLLKSQNAHKDLLKRKPDAPYAGAKPNAPSWCLPRLLSNPNAPSWCIEKPHVALGGGCGDDGMVVRQRRCCLWWCRGEVAVKVMVMKMGVEACMLRVLAVVGDEGEEGGG